MKMIGGIPRDFNKVNEVSRGNSLFSHVWSLFINGDGSIGLVSFLDTTRSSDGGPYVENFWGPLSEIKEFFALKCEECEEYFRMNGTVAGGN